MQGAGDVSSAAGWKAHSHLTGRYGLEGEEAGARSLPWCCRMQQSLCQPKPGPHPCTESGTLCSSEAEKPINSFSYRKSMSSGRPWGVCLQSLISVEESRVGKEYGKRGSVRNHGRCWHLLAENLTCNRTFRYIISFDAWNRSLR